MTIKDEMNQGIYKLIKEIMMSPDLVEKHFPKEKCQERGQALVLHAEMVLRAAKTIAEAIPDKETTIWSKKNRIKLNTLCGILNKVSEMKGWNSYYKFLFANLRNAGRK